MGVRGVSNQTILKQNPTPNSIKDDIVSSIKRRALIDSEEIMVTVHGGKVTLIGVVQSWSEHDMVNDSVWNTLGVTDVKDYISVVRQVIFRFDFLSLGTDLGRFELMRYHYDKYTLSVR